MSLKHDILDFVRDELLDGQGDGLDEHASLLDRGILDSMSLMTLITFIEERTGVRIPNDAVTAANFDTATDIERLVERLREGVA